MPDFMGSDKSFKNEEDLAVRLQLLEYILSIVPAHLYWKDRNGVYLGCNDEQAYALGYSSGKEIVGLTDNDLPWKAQKDNLQQIDAEVMRTRETHVKEEVVALSDGKNSVFLSTKRPLCDAITGDVVGVVGISVDITEQRRLEKELLETRAREERFKATSALGGMIAHELRTPLAALKISAASIHRSLPQLLEGYELGLATGKVQNPIRKDHLEGLKKTLFDIDHCINYAQGKDSRIYIKETAQVSRM